MDPNASLDLMRASIAEVIRLSSTCDEDEKDRDKLITNAMELADYAESLDRWISRGGSLPDSWNAAALTGRAPKA